MKSKYIFNIIIVLAICALPLLFNNCAATHGDDSQNSSSLSGSCAEKLLTGYKNSYFPILTANCGGCHSSGVLMHGSTNVTNSFATFQNKRDSILEYAHGRTNHQTVNATTIAPQAAAAKSVWDAAEASYLTCLSRAGDDDGSGGGVAVTVPSKFTVAKTLIAPVGQTITLSWNLGTEMATASQALAGVQLDLQVKSRDYGYEFRLPYIKNTGTSAAFVKGLAVKVNGVLIPNGTSFYNTQRHISSVATKNERLLSSGGGPIQLGNTGVPLQVAVGFTELRVSEYPNFNPPNYNEMTGAGGVLAVNCASCHSNPATASGGTVLTQANYKNIIGGQGASGNILVTPYNLTSSNLYQKMIVNNASIMPPAGKLADAATNQVRDWILDGARQTAQSTDVCALNATGYILVYVQNNVVLPLCNANVIGAVNNIQLRKIDLSQPTDAELAVLAAPINSRTRFVDSANRANNDNASAFNYTIGNFALLPAGPNSITVTFRPVGATVDSVITVPFTK